MAKQGPHSVAPRVQRGLTRLFLPFARFFRLQAAGGIVLLAATVLALAWANSSLVPYYGALWETRLSLGLGPWGLDKPLLLWVNDGLMAVFFLLVGLEIKREVLTGELSNRRSATLPIVAALGGMVVPALIYLALTRGTPVAGAWGIPMATDIAFTLGALAVLGSRVPASLRVFLAAAAIVDDIGAILVIAVVYTPSVGWVALAVALLATLALILLNRAGVTRIGPYVLLGAVLWVAMLKSGVHATIAGVILAFTIPARSRAMGQLAPAARPFDQAERDAHALAAEQHHEEQASTLARIEHALVGWVSFGIVPVFALANAGVRLEGSLVDALAAPVSLGIVLGLVVGKQIGLLLFPWVAIRLGFASLPTGASWRHMWGIGWLAGIGFTMSIFIAGLALPPDELAHGKLAILAASLVAACGGLIVLALRSRTQRASGERRKA